jgi:hypothetical protein
MTGALAGAVGIGAALSRLFHRISFALSKRPAKSWFVSLSEASAPAWAPVVEIRVARVSADSAAAELNDR